MRRIAKYFVIATAVFLWCNTSAQKRVADSVLALLKPVIEDTSRVSHLNLLAKIYTAKKRDSAVVLVTEALKLGKKINWPTGQGISYQLLGSINYLSGQMDDAKRYYKNADSLWTALEEKAKTKPGSTDYTLDAILNQKAKAIGNLGNVFKDQGEPQEALKCFEEALQIAQKTGSGTIMADNHLRMGLIFMSQAQYPKALKSFLIALKTAEAVKEKDRMAIVLTNLGNLYAQQRDFEKALDYYDKTYKLDEEMGNQRGIARDLGNIGNVYLDRGDAAKSLQYCEKALAIDEAAGDRTGMIFRLSTIASCYMTLKDYKRAESVFVKVIRLAEEAGDKNRVALNASNLGLLYVKTKQFDKALKTLNEALSLSHELGATSLEMECEASLSDLYYYKKNAKMALQHYQRHTALKDSIFNESKNKEITRNELNYEFEKKEAARIAGQERRDAVAIAERRKQELTLYLVSALLILVFMFAGFIAKALNTTKKQKLLIEIKNKETEEQKILIEEKNKDILDSIYYARRIQRSLLPTEKYIVRTFEKLKS